MSNCDELNKFRRDTDEAAQLFSNSGQAMQERTAVAGLLRVLGIQFEDDEIRKDSSEPIDVRFREGAFQVTEVLDPNRSRNREVKERARRAACAKDLADLIEPGTVSSIAIAPDELVSLVEERAKDKSLRYAGHCAQLDFLVYINLKGRHLYPVNPSPSSESTALSRWRSVSVLMEPYGIVLSASERAPSWLVSRVGQTCCWPGLDSMFPKLHG